MPPDPLINADGTLNYDEARKAIRARARSAQTQAPGRRAHHNRVDRRRGRALAMIVAPSRHARTGQACAAFVHFVVEGQDSPAPLARREPSERIYRRLFREHPEMVSV
jgi:hypothetical protein